MEQAIRELINRGWELVAKPGMHPDFFGAVLERNGERVVINIDDLEPLAIVKVDGRWRVADKE